jgi:hypothetical protein
MYEDRIYLQLRLSKSIETDDNGNYIIECEASNENLDYDGQIVLQRALLDSKDYFLKNGVISYDHRHLRADPEDPHWTPEKYIIGEPIDVYKVGKGTFVKAKLYKSNPLVQDIVKKLKDGSTRLKTSVGGRRPQVVSEWDQKLGRIVEKVTKVLWDELAITFKPVNQTLEPIALSGAAFVKSLTSGFATNSAGMTGGQAMVAQDLEGDEKKDKPHKIAVVMALAAGELQDVDEAKEFLMNRGYSAAEAEKILRSILNDKHMETEVSKMADNKLLEAFQKSLDTLEKRLKGKKAKAEDEEMEEAQPSFDEEFPPVNDEDAGDEAQEGEEDQLKKKKKTVPFESEEGVGEDEEYMEKCNTKPLKKSIYEEIEVEDGDLLEVTPFLRDLTKSISDRIGELSARISRVESLQKAIGSSVHATGLFLKSLSEEPSPRKAVLNRQERFFNGANGEHVSMTRDEIMAKAREAVQQGKISLLEMGVMEERLNKGLPISDADMRMLKSL